MGENSALTPQEVADILKIAKNTVYALIKRGELNSYRVGKKVRVDINDVEAYKDSTKRHTSQNAAQQGNNPNISRSEISASPQYQRSRPNGFVICGQDIILDILSRYLENHPNGVHALRSYVGSYNSLYALYNGNVDLATAHLWDGDTGQYNVPYVRRMLPGTPAVIVHLACRMQGFYIAKGNPKGITGWQDLKRSDLTLVNREKGSGTRILLDEQLMKLGIVSNTIRGYDNECTSHLAIASTVARGEADMGIGNEKAAQQVKEVDFIPLQKERYDLVMKKEDYGKPHFKAVLEILRSSAFKLELEGIGGYDLNDTGKIVSET